MTTPSRPLIVGTRASRLARVQTDLVVAMLRAAHGTALPVEVRAQETEGDHTQAANVPLQSVAGRGVFVKDLEVGLLSHTFDLVVHSLKDITTDLAEGLQIAAVPGRADVRDVLVSPSGLMLAALPAGARVGTSSPRRAAQLAAQRPDLVFAPIRGNVDTRIRKADSGEYDAVVLAAAGMDRLGLSGRITEYFDAGVCMPDPGQGALAIEVRADDAATIALLAPLNDPAARACVDAERALLHALGGGCQLPVGGWATVEGERLTLRAVACSPSGRHILRHEAAGAVGDAAQVGQELAEQLLQQGARALLEEVVGG